MIHMHINKARLTPYICSPCVRNKTNEQTGFLFIVTDARDKDELAIDSHRERYESLMVQHVDEIQRLFVQR